jgi:glycosyltransferase involved in cell wall biosynthesis
MIFFEETYSLPKRFEGHVSNISQECAFVANLILENTYKDPKKLWELSTQRPEIFAAIAKIESLSKSKLFYRNWTGLNEELIKNSFVKARKAMGVFFPLHFNEWKDFFNSSEHTLLPKNIKIQYPVSLIVPCYKPAKHLKIFKDQISSIGQYFQEILVVDDGSPDEECKLLDKELKEIENLRIIKNSANEGPAVARNLGIEKSKGQWCFFMDFDDILNPSLLPYVLHILCLQNKKKIFTTLVHKIPANVIFYSRLFSFPDLAFENQVAVNLFISRDFIKSLPFSLYNPKLRSHFEDWEANLKLRLLGHKAWVIPLPLYCYKTNPQGRQLSPSLSQWNARKELSNVYQILPKLIQEKMMKHWMRLLSLKIQKLSWEKDNLIRNKNFSWFLGKIGQKIDAFLDKN